MLKYFFKTTIITFSILIGSSLVFVFGISSLDHFLDFNFFGFLGSFLGWPLGGFVTWYFLKKNPPIELKNEISYFWIKKFMIITTIAGSIATPWSIVANTSTLYLFSGENPFLPLLTNASSGFAWPIGYVVGWKTQVLDKTIPQIFGKVYFWAQRAIFLMIVLSLLPFSTYLGIPFQIVLPFPFGIYIVYFVIALLVILSIRFAFKNFKPEN